MEYSNNLKIKWRQSLIPSLLSRKKLVIVAKCNPKADIKVFSSCSILLEFFSLFETFFQRLEHLSTVLLKVTGKSFQNVNVCLKNTTLNSTGDHSLEIVLLEKYYVNCTNLVAKLHKTCARYLVLTKNLKLLYSKNFPQVLQSLSVMKHVNIWAIYLGQLGWHFQNSSRQGFFTAKVLTLAK